MEYLPKPQERENPSPTTSPNGGGGGGAPSTAKATTPRSDPNPYPTTFVQADSASFKQVVQMLTGSGEAAKQTPPRQHSQIPPKRQGFKLYERRNSSVKNSLMINTLGPNFPAAGFSPRNKPEILSPSILDFPSLTLSPVTPLPPPSHAAEPSTGNGHTNESYRSSSSCSSSEEEERAIAEKGFYLSSAGTPRDAEPPQLLPLFPVTSPRVSGSAASSLSSVSLS